MGDDSWTTLRAFHQLNTCDVVCSSCRSFLDKFGSFPISSLKLRVSQLPECTHVDYCAHFIASLSWDVPVNPCRKDLVDILPRSDEVVDDPSLYDMCVDLDNEKNGLELAAMLVKKNVRPADDLVSYSITAGKLKIAKLMASHGAASNVSKSDVMIAVSNRQPTSTVTAMASVCSEAIDDEEMLSAAVEALHIDLVTHLIEKKGASPNMECVRRAITLGDRSLAATLLQHTLHFDADEFMEVMGMLDAGEGAGSPLAPHAADGRDLEEALLVNDAESVERILAAGARADTQMLELAVQSACAGPDLVRALVHAGAEITPSVLCFSAIGCDDGGKLRVLLKHCAMSPDAELCVMAAAHAQRPDDMVRALAHVLKGASQETRRRIQRVADARGHAGLKQAVGDILGEGGAGAPTKNRM
jgi:hypothetical protein